MRAQTNGSFLSSHKNFGKRSDLPMTIINAEKSTHLQQVKAFKYRVMSSDGVTWFVKWLKTVEDATTPTVELREDYDESLRDSYSDGHWKPAFETFRTTNAFKADSSAEFGLLKYVGGTRANPDSGNWLSYLPVDRYHDEASRKERAGTFSDITELRQALEAEGYYIHKQAFSLLNTRHAKPHTVVPANANRSIPELALPPLFTQRLPFATNPAFNVESVRNMHFHINYGNITNNNANDSSSATNDNGDGRQEQPPAGDGRQEQPPAGGTPATREEIQADLKNLRKELREDQEVLVQKCTPRPPRPAASTPTMSPVNLANRMQDSPQESNHGRDVVIHDEDFLKKLYQMRINGVSDMHWNQVQDMDFEYPGAIVVYNITEQVPSLLETSLKAPTEGQDLVGIGTKVILGSDYKSAAFFVHNPFNGKNDSSDTDSDDDESIDSNDCDTGEDMELFGAPGLGLTQSQDIHVTFGSGTAILQVVSIEGIDAMKAMLSAALVGLARVSGASELTMTTKLNKPLPTVTTEAMRAYGTRRADSHDFPKLVFVKTLIMEDTILSPLMCSRCPLIFEECKYSDEGECFANDPAFIRNGTGDPSKEDTGSGHRIAAHFIRSCPNLKFLMQGMQHAHFKSLTLDGVKISDPDDLKCLFQICRAATERGFQILTDDVTPDSDFVMLKGLFMPLRSIVRKNQMIYEYATGQITEDQFYDGISKAKAARIGKNERVPSVGIPNTPVTVRESVPQVGPKRETEVSKNGSENSARFDSINTIDSDGFLDEKVGGKVIASSPVQIKKAPVSVVKSISPTDFESKDAKKTRKMGMENGVRSENSSIVDCTTNRNENLVDAKAKGKTVTLPRASLRAPTAASGHSNNDSELIDTVTPVPTGRCHGKTKTGRSCRRSARDGEIFCFLHRDG